MLYFEQLLIAMVIYDVINHMNKYLRYVCLLEFNVSLSQ